MPTDPEEPKVDVCSRIPVICVECDRFGTNKDLGRGQTSSRRPRFGARDGRTGREQGRYGRRGWRCEYGIRRGYRSVVTSVRLLVFSHPLFPDEPVSGRKSRKPWQPPHVKTLTEEDVDKYSIFDVVMPLPGNDVAFPEGELGKKYREYLLRDGLDPDNFQRRQK